MEMCFVSKKQNRLEVEFLKSFDMLPYDRHNHHLKGLGPRPLLWVEMEVKVIAIGYMKSSCMFSSRAFWRLQS